jgi:rSAM/selenodomain-associated transferase 1
MQNDSAIVVMAKQPQVGRTKTRLCPPFTSEEAAGLYEALLRDTLTLAGSIHGADLAVAITPAAARDYFAALTPPGTHLLAISGADIGECLASSIADLLARGYRRVIAFNADGPSLPAACLEAALAALDSCDVVFGPGEDGGYYLVGLNQMQAALFQGIPWSTAQVLANSLEKAQALGLRIQLLPAWYDVDTAADARRLAGELQHLPPERLPHTRAFIARFTRPALFDL